MNNPLVSILIPTYNREDYLGEALNSALNQTYKNIEIIVHDDASTDGTVELLSAYSDPRLKVIRTENNHGMIGGWNYIVKQAKGIYIKFLASDDLLEPKCVEKLVAAAENNPRAALITCQRKFIDGDSHMVKKMGFAKKSTVTDGRIQAKWILTTLRENKIGEPSAVLYPSRLVIRAGEYDSRFSQFADFEYWIRLLAHGDLVYLHDPLCSFRLHEGANTASAIRDGRFITETFALIAKYYSPRQQAGKDRNFVKIFGLTPQDYKKVIRVKILDILKNIKDLVMAGKLAQAINYTIQLFRGGWHLLSSGN